MVVLLTTTKSIDDAEKLAKIIIKAKLVACVSLIPKIISFYVWQEKLEKSEEVQLLCKTSVNKQEELIKLIKKNHPYQTPEIITLPILKAEKDYQAWVIDYLS